jgi:hypothetical protein
MNSDKFLEDLLINICELCYLNVSVTHDIKCEYCGVSNLKHKLDKRG